MATDFDERSGVVRCQAPWGCWYQTLEDVVLEIDFPEGTSARNIKCVLEPSRLSVSLSGKCILQGPLFETIVADESTWTLEENRLLHIVLVKSVRQASHCWSALLKGSFMADPWTLDQMQRKLTLERFQTENPGFDFSKAEVSGNYSTGGPDLSPNV
uniref:nudC domain-containing protein 2 n=1 Tax=Myxine glutinosa TaxID=7769 RepID=UPI00358FC16C